MKLIKWAILGFAGYKAYEIGSRYWRRFAMQQGMMLPETRKIEEGPELRRSNDLVSQASVESFPASDAPSFTPGVT